MEGQGPYLTKDHERLLNYAAWAKYLAWVVLAVFTIGAVLGFIGQMNIASYQSAMSGHGTSTLAEWFQRDPTDLLNVLFAAGRALFQGLVYFLVLKGISLGLFMVAETDVNYRDRTENAK